MDRPWQTHVSRRFLDFSIASSFFNSNNCSGSVLLKNWWLGMQLAASACKICFRVAISSTVPAHFPNFFSALKNNRSQLNETSLLHDCNLKIYINYFIFVILGHSIPLQPLLYCLAFTGGLYIIIIFFSILNACFRIFSWRPLCCTLAL